MADERDAKWRKAEHPLAALARYIFPKREDFPGEQIPDMNRAHPPELPNGLIERGVKAVATHMGSLIDPDLPYLEQYFHPDVDILPRSTLSPTIGGTEGMVVRQPLLDYPAGTDKPSATEYGGFLGLGNYSRSHVPDEHGPYPLRGYDRVEDVWDFDTKAPMFNNVLGSSPRMEAAAKAVLRRVGTPYVLRENVRSSDVELMSDAQRVADDARRAAEKKKENARLDRLKKGVPSRRSQ